MINILCMCREYLSRYAVRLDPVTGSVRTVMRQDEGDPPEGMKIVRVVTVGDIYKWRAEEPTQHDVYTEEPGDKYPIHRSTGRHGTKI